MTAFHYGVFTNNSELPIEDSRSCRWKQHKSSLSYAVAFVTPSDVSKLLSYDCLPDGIIHVHGVPKGYTITSIHGGSSCQVTQIEAHDYALGRSCTQHEYYNYPYYKYLYRADIQISHSSSNIVGGNGFNPFRLICDKIHSGGKVFDLVTHMYVNDSSRYGSSVIPTLPYARKSENNRRYTRQPEMFFSKSQYSNYPDYYNDIITGSLVYVHISSGDQHYAVRPENCTARASYYDYGGDNSVELWDVTKDRCVLEPYLMEKFVSRDNDQTAVSAPLYAFHFGSRSDYNTHAVYFECSVRVCSRGSFSCNLNVCDDVRRGERSAEDDDDYDHHLVTKTLEIRQNGNSSDKKRCSIVTTVLGVLAMAFSRKFMGM
ncbi:uncharacterized protein LOC132552944 [Ylistrum balloti]|uniref:uncharacterized protein LOC132552944 n=1 Tax=Ylistrum balloti TaxID=509963 RepID=UPI002905C2B0|nr:uncharacterized protein LOC132552944 [Ylistrum balloti]